MTEKKSTTKTTRKRRSKKEKPAWKTIVPRYSGEISDLLCLKSEIDWDNSMAKEHSLDVAVEALTKSEWISFKQTVPGRTGVYYVTVLINDIGLGMYPEVRTAIYNTVFKKWHVHTEDQNLVGEVLAWMPCPPMWEGANEV